MLNTPMNTKEFYTLYPYPNVLDTFPRGLENYSSIDAPINFQGKIFVIGCGTAEAICIALKNPKSKILAIDLSPTSIKISKELSIKYKINNLNFEVNDITNYVPQETFDIAVSSCVIHHIFDVGKAIDNIYKSLNREGIFQGNVYSKNRPRYIREISDKKFQSLFDLKTFLSNNSNQWYNDHLKNDEELADTYLNPYYKEYTISSLKDLFYQFKEKNFVPRNDKIHFQCCK